jgi:hypothetical protein
MAAETSSEAVAKCLVRGTPPVPAATEVMFRSIDPSPSARVTLLLTAAIRRHQW